MYIIIVNNGYNYEGQLPADESEGTDNYGVQ